MFIIIYLFFRDEQINENLNKIETNSPVLLEVNSNGKNDNELNDDGIQTRSKTVRRKRGGGIINYTTVRRKNKRVIFFLYVCTCVSYLFK